MKRIMVDLECFGQEHDAAICQIGAVKFTVDGELSDGIQLNVDARDCVRHGATLTCDTIYWWLQQEEAARRSICQPGMPELEALTKLAEYLDGADEIWSHATYDFVIIHNAMKRRGVKPPSFRAARDIRTLVALAPSTRSWQTIGGVKHTALDDAINQAQYTAAMIKCIKDQVK